MVWERAPVAAPLVDHALAEFAEGVVSCWGIGDGDRVVAVVDDVGWVEDGTISDVDDGVFGGWGW